jgi:hypothetical protein
MRTFERKNKGRHEGPAKELKRWAIVDRWKGGVFYDLQVVIAIFL